jgi:nicotinate phosphoribosyltransferase
VPHVLHDLVAQESRDLRRDQGLPEEAVLVDPVDPTRLKRIPPEARATDLLEPVVRAGRPVRETPPLDAARARAADQLARLHPGITRFVNPHEYPVGLSAELHELKMRLVLDARGA